MMGAENGAAGSDQEVSSGVYTAATAQGGTGADAGKMMIAPTANVVAKDSGDNDESSTLTNENSNQSEELRETEDLNDEPQKTFPQRVSYDELRSLVQYLLVEPKTSLC